MSKITVLGDALVVKSELKLEEIETLKKYRPAALKLMGGEDGKDEIFAIDTASGKGSICKFGATFNRAAEDGCALLTVQIDPGEKDVKEFVADKIGEAIIKLNELEAQIPAVLNEVLTQKAQLIDSISIVA